MHGLAVSKCRVSRLSYALLAALALHGLLLLTHVRHSPARPSVALQKPEELVEVEEALPDEASSTIAMSPSAQRAARVASAQPAALAPRAGSRVPEAEMPTDALSGVEESANGVASAVPGAASSAEAAGGKPARKIDFGIDDGFFMRPASEELPRVPKADLPTPARSGVVGRRRAPRAGSWRCVGQLTQCRGARQGTGAWRGAAERHGRPRRRAHGGGIFARFAERMVVCAGVASARSRRASSYACLRARAGCA